MKTKLLALVLTCFATCAKAADDCPALLRDPDEDVRLGEMRVKAIRGWDKLLTWALTPKNTKYVLASPPTARSFSLTNQEIDSFVYNYGYFSIYRPIVGIVTDDKRDVKVTSCLLSAVSHDSEQPLGRQFAQDEILAKVLAYRTLEKGMKIDLGDVIYKVDEVIDMWRGMPAFGLVSNTPHYPPILLYRGTDLNVVTEKGWASILSDLDVNGPGHSTYLGARHKIRNWLNKMQKTPPRLIGYSLGGVFVLYTLIHDHDLVSKRYLSIAFNPPGVSEEMLEKWEAISEEIRPEHITYVNEGDFVSQIGLFLSDVWEISTPKPMGVIESHVSLITAKPEFTLTKVDVEGENAQRR